MAGARLSAAAVKVQMLVIGNNRAFVEGDGAAADAVGQPLQFADDDAAAFYDLMAEIADTGHLLTVMDGDTQAAYPELSAVARPPTLGELRAAVAALARRIEENHGRGDRNVLYIFFSGHGAVIDGKGPALALLDGGISHQLLYDEILGKLPADYVHVFVDACHAEGVVRPRDTQARAVAVSPADADAFLVRSTLARFPHVGAIVAASSDAQAHEWDQLGHGVFTHELLSALRGAADVNRDGRIEYSEIYAFLAAANRGIGDPRARLSVVARAPEVDRHIAVVELAHLPTKMAQLKGVPARAGLVELEDGAGRRLASLRGEPGFIADLSVPTGTTYVRAGNKEARFESRPGQIVSFESLVFHDTRSRARGALEDAVRRGLFAGEFGRGYYRGFIDQSPDFVPVSFAAMDVVRSEPSPVVARDGSDGRSERTTLLVAGVGLSSTVATTVDRSEAIRVGLRPSEGRGLSLSVDVTRAARPGAAEWHAIAWGGGLWGARLGPARGWVGAAIGGGVIEQTVSGGQARWTGLVAAGPVVGAAVQMTGRLALWSEAQLAGIAYRLDASTAFSLAPSVFLGMSLGL